MDISSGGACIESEFLHAEDEVLRLWVKLRVVHLLVKAPDHHRGAHVPGLEGQPSRQTLQGVVEYQPGKFRYGFLFAQLKESELTELKGA